MDYNAFKDYKKSFEECSEKEVIAELHRINREIGELEDKKRAINQIICDKKYY